MSNNKKNLRNKILSVRFSSDEMKNVERAANRIGEFTSTYVREVVLKHAGGNHEKE